MNYKVKQVADMADISVRTLHHYDAVGLLKPSSSSESGYRLYSEPDIERLQQILFFRELGFSLADIKAILDNPSFDRRAALSCHRELLLGQKMRIEKMVALVDRTITAIERGKPMPGNEMFEAFDRSQMEKYKQETRERFNPELVKESEERTAAYTEQQWIAIQTEQSEIYAAIADLLSCAPGDEQVQTLINRHYQSINRYFYTCTLDVYAGLADLYVGDQRFKAFFEKVRPGLASFIREAMLVYCQRQGEDQARS